VRRVGSQSGACGTGEPVVGQGLKRRAVLVEPSPEIGIRTVPAGQETCISWSRIAINIRDGPFPRHGQQQGGSEQEDQGNHDQSPTTTTRWFRRPNVSPARKQRPKATHMMTAIVKDI